MNGAFIGERILEVYSAHSQSTPIQQAEATRKKIFLKTDKLGNISMKNRAKKNATVRPPRK